MTQILLHCLNVVSGSDRHGGVCMAKIMETGVGSSDPGNNALEAVIDGTVGEVSTDLIGKDHVVVLPEFSRFCPKAVLMQLLEAEKLEHRGGQGQRPGLSIFGRGEVVFSAFLLLSAKLLLDEQSSPLEVHTIPGESQDLSLSKSCEENNLIQIFVRVALDRS